MYWLVTRDLQYSLKNYDGKLQNFEVKYDDATKPKFLPDLATTCDRFVHKQIKSISNKSKKT